MNLPPTSDSPRSEPPLHARWRIPRWGRRVLLGLLVFYVVYLIAGNVFLNTSLGEYALNRKPEKFQMHWHRGVTWWPGQVVLWDVTLGGHVRRNQWEVQGKRASGHVGVWPLLGKRLRMSGIRAEEVRGKVERVEQEIPPPPYRPGGWKLEFPSIQSESVLGGSWGPLKISGHGSAQVGFNKQLRGGAMELLPSQADLRDTEVVLKGLALLQQSHLKADFSMKANRSAQTSAAEKVKLTNITLSLDGTTAGLVLRNQEDGHVQMEVEPGAGRTQGQLALSEGELSPGGTLQWQMPVRVIDVQGQDHRDNLDLRLQVDENLHLQAKLPGRADGMLSASVDATLDGRQVLVTEPRELLPRVSGHVRGRWQFSSLKWLTQLFVNAPWLSLEGSGQVESDLRVDHGMLISGSRVAVPRVAAVAEVVGSRIEGSASAEARLTEVNGKPRSQLEVNMQRFVVAPREEIKSRFVEGKDLHLTLDGPADLAKMQDNLQAHVAFRDAQVPDLRAYNRYLPNAHARFEGGRGTLSGDLYLDASGRVGHGRVDLRGDATRLQMADIALTGDVNIGLRLQRADLNNSRLDMAGSRVGLRNVSFQGGEGSRTGWWANLDLEKASLGWDKRLDVKGGVQLRMKNVAFVLDLFSQQKSYPKWTLNLIDAGEAQVTTQVDWYEQTLLLRDIHAHNDRFELDGQFRLQGAHRHGDLYASWGVLGMAVELRDDQQQFHILGARRWYEGQPRLTP